MARLTVDDLFTQIDWGRLSNLCPYLSDGVTPDPRALKITNRAQERMLARGDWIGSTQVIRFCITSGCITVPRQVERIDAAMLNGAVLTLRNAWFEFVPPLTGHCGNGWFWGWGPFNWNGGDLEDHGYYPTFRDITPGSKKIRIYPDSPADLGKEVFIQAIDDNDQVIVEDPSYNGFKMTIASPYVESTYFVSQITGVIKPVTEKNLNLYEDDTLNGDALTLLAIYEPGETTVQLRRYKIPGFCQTSALCPTQTLLALVKLRHVPVVRGTDYLVIQSAAAFEEFIRMLEKKDAGNTPAAQEAELDGVRELNLQKRNASPGTQVTVAVRSQGLAQPWRHRVGNIR